MALMAVAHAKQDEGAGPLQQHEGKILATHHRRGAIVDPVRSDDVARGLGREVGLVRMIDRRRIHPGVGRLRRAAIGARDAIGDFPDPALLRTAEGWFHAYATQGTAGNDMLNIQAARSRDLVHWELLGDALPQKPVWASRKQAFWAPHVVYDAQRSRYVMYYSAEPDAASGKCLAVAVSSVPQGPFADAGGPLLAIERLTLGTEGRPLELLRSVYLPNYFRLSISLTRRHD